MFFFGGAFYFQSLYLKALRLAITAFLL